MCDSSEKLMTILKQVMNDADQLGIPYSRNIAGIKINYRATSRFGCCKRTKENLGKDQYVIEISSRVLSCQTSIIKDIVAHELLHTVKGCYNHQRKWKNMADSLNNEFGYYITTTTTYDKLNLDKPPERENNKYLIVCKKCGRKFYRKRTCNVVKHTNRYRCSCCGGQLKTIVLEQDKRSSL